MQPWQNWGISWDKFIHAESRFPNKYQDDTAMR